jgi:hypothetical protein
MVPVNKGLRPSLAGGVIIVGLVVSGCQDAGSTDSGHDHPATQLVRAVQPNSTWRASATCAQVATSRTNSMPAPAQTRLTGALHVGGDFTLRPAPAGYKPTVALEEVWPKTQLLLERDARYQVFLARAWSPTLGHLSGPFFHGQVFWVALSEGTAGSETGPAPSGVTLPPPSACFFYGRFGFSISSATKPGKPYVVT